jgi:hypothetical protein
MAGIALFTAQRANQTATGNLLQYKPSSFTSPNIAALNSSSNTMAYRINQELFTVKQLSS